MESISYVLAPISNYLIYYPPQGVLAIMQNVCYSFGLEHGYIYKMKAIKRSKKIILKAVLYFTVSSCCFLQPKDLSSLYITLNVVKNG
jgi:hypothetical protein